MQVHGPSQVIGAGDLSVDFNPGSPSVGPFAMVSIGLVDLFLNSPEEADALIRVAVEAKRLLSPEPEPAVIPPAGRDCPAVNDGGWHCHLSGAHAVHEDDNGGQWADATDVCAVLALRAS